MLKLIAVITVGLTLTGCSVPNLSDIITPREPGSLIVVCPGGKVILNTGEQKKACFDFMETDTDS